MKQNYSELLKDPRWVSRSKEIKEWDRGVCQCCGDSGRGANLQVHHLYYDLNKMPWEYGDKALITLCDKCHKDWHRIDNSFWSLVKERFNKLGENGCDKYAILTFLDMIVKLTSDEKYTDLAYELARILSDEGISFLYNIWGRSHKNNMWKSIREKEKVRISFAKKAHKWANSKTPFNEDAYYDGEYCDEIREYREYLGEED